MTDVTKLGQEATFESWFNSLEQAGDHTTEWRVVARDRIRHESEMRVVFESITRHFPPAMTALREALDATGCACSDEEAAHQDTLRQLAELRAENGRLNAERDESIEERKEFQRGENAALQRAEAAEAERDRLRAAAKPFVDWIQWNGNLPTGEQGKALVAALTTAPTSEKEV